jgi:hypothetical protein
MMMVQSSLDYYYSNEKNFYVSLYHQKKNQLIWLKRGGDIQNSCRKDTYGPPCTYRQYTNYDNIKGLN